MVTNLGSDESPGGVLRGHDPPTDRGLGAVAEWLRESGELAGAWRDVRLQAGEELFEEGEPGDAFYTLLEGELEVFTSAPEGERMVLARLGPGAHVGELAPLDGGTRTASVAAIVPSRLAALHRDAFLETLANSPDLARDTVAVLARRMRRTLGYVRMISHWAELVAEGRYDAARNAVRHEAGQAADRNVALFVDAFVEMIDVVHRRERELKRELLELSLVIDEQERARRLREVTDTDFFRDLEERARSLRRHHRGDKEDTS